ncbi:MAG: MoxR family ATPase [Gammaproteobacteria bacterium]|nr:MoxR family ATPase [Gammaproteobacteria bacterium]NNM00370.1 MoxR family ATPase [Gammaproteobacteria bacterium]
MSSKITTLAGAGRARRPGLAEALEAGSRIIVGKQRELTMALTCMLARGHLLIEDVPGVGKTTLAQVIARLLGLSFQRIQFTSDLLPADVVGVSIYDRDGQGFRFHPGPLFAQLVLADEVNRATPRAQSALLEGMEERQVTVEGESHPLPEPFFVVATQNPSTQIGTYPLPESQLDRFLMRIELGYPDRQAERELLAGDDRRAMLADLAPVLDPATVMDMQQRARQVHVSEALLEYVQALLEFTREAPFIATGLSPRAGLAMLHAARAWAFVAGRDHVEPEDLQAIIPSVIEHRLAGGAGAEIGGPLSQAVIKAVPIP